MKFEQTSLTDTATMKAWDGFVETHPDATPCHLSCWLSAIRATYSYEPLIYMIKDDTGALAGVFPLFKIRSPLTGNRIVSLPFSDYGGPLLRDRGQGAEALGFLKLTFAKSAKYIEVRGPIQNNDGFLRYDYYKRHAMAIGNDIESLQKKIDKKTILYSIRKAEKAGVVVKQENTRAGLDEFCRLNNLTRRKHGVPCQPHAFFENIFDHVIATGHGFILAARHESKVIAASLFLLVGKQIHYKYSASDPALLRKYSPNHLLTWEVITWGHANGYTALDFGRTSPDNEGLIRYKNMWGMENIDLPYYYYPAVKGAASTKESGLRYRIMTGLWRHLPITVAEKASSIIFKHMG